MSVGSPGHRGPVVFGTAADLLNPYPRMLYEEMRRRGHEVRVGRLSEALRTNPRHTPLVVHLHWFGFLFRMRSVLRCWAAMLHYGALLAAVRLRGHRIVWTFHNELSHDGRHPRLERAFQRFVGNLIADRIVVLSDHGRQVVGRRISPRAERRSSVVPHPTYETVYGPPVDRARARHHLGLPDGETTLLFFGRVHPYKGVVELLEAFRRVDGEAVRLVVAGECPDPSLRSSISELASSDRRVDLRLGRVPDEEVRFWFCAADWVVLPYRRVLNSGVSYLAMTYGRPVIAPALESLRGVLSTPDGPAGMLYDPDHPEGLAGALEGASAQPDLSEQLSARMSALKVDRSLAVIGAKLVTAYDSPGEDRGSDSRSTW